MIDVPDTVLLDYLGQQSGLEIHLSDVHFTQGGKVKVFWNGNNVGEGDDVRKALVMAMHRIGRARRQRELHRLNEM